jgi:hypothetical protein
MAIKNWERDRADATRRATYAEAVSTQLAPTYR